MFTFITRTDERLVRAVDVIACRQGMTRNQFVVQLLRESLAVAPRYSWEQLKAELKAELLEELTEYVDEQIEEMKRRTGGL